MVDFNLSEEQEIIVSTVRQFTEAEIAPKAAMHDKTMEYPWEIVRKAHETGLLNASVPTALGGSGLDHLSQNLIIEELARGCTGISTAITANDLALGPLLEFGSDELLAELVPPMLEPAEKPKMAAYCVTEPGAGSDVQGIRTLAEKDGEDYIVSGEKMWITNGSVASWYYVLATLDPSRGYESMIAFAIPSNLKGITVGKKEVNLGQRCSDTRGITFDKVKVAARYRIGGEGQGFKIAMRAFDLSRPMVAAGAVGISQACLDHSMRYAQERKAFGKPIAHHQAIQFMIADMARDIEASRMLAWRSAWLLDEGHRNTKIASMAKCLAGDTAVMCSSSAVQIFGGYGYNSEYPVEKLYRDAKIYQIYEGTQQIQRMIIGRQMIEENRI